jgi:ferredoxin-nitrite reductase
MNKIELLKRERDGLDVKELIHEYARTGWESISESDIQRLKWHGLFLRNPTPGYFMVRVRILGGRTNSYQLRALAGIAASPGNGLLDLTTRQQIQLRHIPIKHVPGVFAKLEEVGLTTLQTGMDNVRNVMTCAVAGVSPDEICDGIAVARAIDEEILNNRDYSNLPRKMNIAVTGCPDNCIHMETQDLALVPAYYDIGYDKCFGFNVLVGGKLGSGGYRIASPLNVFVNPAETFDVCRAVIRLFRDHGPRENRTQARLAFLVDDWGIERFRAEVEREVGRALSPAGVDARKGGEKDHVGIFRQRQRGMNYAGLKVLVGRITAADLQAVCSLAERYGSGEIRLTPSQSLIVINVPDRKIGDLAQEPLVHQFTYNPSPLYKGLVSCVGNDYCNLAVIETKRRAVETAKQLEKRLSSTLKPITMHWSGCPAGCGNHLVADIGLLGKKCRVDGKVVDAVDIFVGGRAGIDPKLAVKIMEDVPCDKLPIVLEGLVPYHTREKMHRVRGGEMKKSTTAGIGNAAGTKEPERVSGVRGMGVILPAVRAAD